MQLPKMNKAVAYDVLVTFIKFLSLSISGLILSPLHHNLILPLTAFSQSSHL